MRKYTFDANFMSTRYVRCYIICNETGREIPSNTPAFYVMDGEYWEPILDLLLDSIEKSRESQSKQENDLYGLVQQMRNCPDDRVRILGDLKVGLAEKFSCLLDELSNSISPDIKHCLEFLIDTLNDNEWVCVCRL